MLNYTSLAKLTNLCKGPPVRGYVDPDFPNPDGPWDTPIIIYGYLPSFALALVACILFLLSFILHATQTIRTRSWWFIPFSVGLALEVVGYVARSLSAKQDPYHLIYFIINYFFIVTAPVLMAAGMYTILSVLIYRLGTKYSLMPAKAILWFFITSDVISTIVQVTGASLIGSLSAKRKDPTVANDILLGGLAYQVFAMTAFIILAGIFIKRAWQPIKDSGLSVFIYVFSAATLLIYLRTVFRLAETAEGLYSSVQTHEVYFACLEFVPVALAVLLVGGWHPGRYLGSKMRGDVSEDRKNEPSAV